MSIILSGCGLWTGRRTTTSTTESERFDGTDVCVQKTESPNTGKKGRSRHLGPGTFFFKTRGLKQGSQGRRKSLKHGTSLCLSFVARGSGVEPVGPSSKIRWSETLLTYGGSDWRRPHRKERTGKRVPVGLRGPNYKMRRGVSGEDKGRDMLTKSWM